jgi:hypothetical protein
MSYIPLIGFVVNAIRVYQAQRAYFACHAKGLPCWNEYNATWPAFEQFQISMLVALLFCVVGLIASALRLTRLRKTLAEKGGE